MIEIMAARFSLNLFSNPSLLLSTIFIKSRLINLALHILRRLHHLVVYLKCVFAQVEFSVFVVIVVVKVVAHRQKPKYPHQRQSLP